jgi:hypothetical protein
MAVACLLAGLSSTAAGAVRPSPVSFSVTLKATVTKDWNTVSDATEDGCDVTRRSIGRRSVTLRSSRPSTVVVSFGSRGVSFSPAAVRFVGVRVEQSGETRTTTKSPCPVKTRRARCPRVRRTLGGGTFRFFRSGRNEIAFHPANLPDARSSCPRESVAVRSIRHGLQDARGEVSEASLANARIPSQTAFASAELTTDLEGAASGQVVERVRWELTFTRKR